jgi:hypothetical protein
MGNVLLRWRLIMIGVPVAMNTAMILLGAGLGSLTGESGAGGHCTGNWLAAKVLKMMRISSTDCVLVSYLVKDSTVVLVNVVVNSFTSDSVVVMVAVSLAAV